MAVFIAFVTSIALAGVAAWFSITGLMAIFAALPLSVAIMAGVLEVGKLVTASILYRNWSTIPALMKGYLSAAVVVLMLITSLGIFGYLSKAHLEQNAPVSNNIAKIERLEQRIEREERIIADAETVIAQLDDTVATLIEYDKISGPDGARAVRDSQQEQRNLLDQSIDEAQARIDEYLDEKFQFEQQVRDFETEVGPIKYLAALAYDNPAEHYDTAVRAIILLLIFVFDPLAVLLLITANHLQIKRDGEKIPDPQPASDDDLFDVADYKHEQSRLDHEQAVVDNEELNNQLERLRAVLRDEHEHPSLPQPKWTETEEDLGPVEEAFHDAEELPWRIQVQEDWDSEEEDELPEPPPMPENTEHPEHEIRPTTSREETFSPRQSQQRAAVQRQMEALKRVAGSTDVSRVGTNPPRNPLADVYEKGKDIG
jgi:hypothetical protein